MTKESLEALEALHEVMQMGKGIDREALRVYYLNEAINKGEHND